MTYKLNSSMQELQKTLATTSIDRGIYYIKAEVNSSHKPSPKRRAH